MLWSGLASFTSPFKNFEERTVDWRFLFRGPRGERAPEIVLVLIEEEADLDYRSPIPRKHLAEIIETLSEAKLIGLDIFLDKPSFDKEGDARLKRAIEQNHRVIGVSFIGGGQEHKLHPYFRDALLDFGYATFSTGADLEVIRKGTVAWDLKDERSLSLAGCIYAHYMGLDAELLRSGTTVSLPGGIPVGGSFPINFSGPPAEVYRRTSDELPGGFTVCPSHLLISGIYPSAVFKEKIVLIGSGLDDTPDRFRTPFFASSFGYEKMLGVEVHAHSLRTLLSGEHLKSWGEGLSFLSIFVLALVIAWAVLYTDTLKSAGVLIISLMGLWVIGFILFSQRDMLLPLVLPSLGMLCSYGIATAYYALTEGREKRRTRRLFEKYLSPDVIHEFLQDPTNWELGGKSVDITVMFADLEGFTPLSESLTPEDMVSLINKYFTQMSAIILQHSGTIDKYEGDLIMAFFGAPLPQEDHAVRSCRAALQMQEAIVLLNQRWDAQGYPELRVRIGLHSGQAVVGNMGSDFRFNYTAMGDTVNLAARLEKANKEFGTYTLISQATRAQAGNGFRYRSLGEIKVRGRSESTTVYELLPAADRENSQA